MNNCTQLEIDSFIARRQMKIRELSNLKMGDVIFVQGDTLISRIIMKVTKSKWSHVAVYIGDGMVVDTDMFRNVSIHSLSDFPAWTAYRHKDMTEDKATDILLYMYMRIGYNYDYLQIAGFLFESLFNWKNTIQSDGGYTCGEFIDEAFAVHGFDLAPSKITGDVTPEDLMEAPWLTIMSHNMK